jgi:hypothetical protein
MFAIGNGESRRVIDINSLRDYKIGCNAIYRDCKMDHLVCADKRMIEEALSAGANISTLIYTRADWYNNYQGFLHVRKVPDLPYASSARWDDPFHWGSGPYAVLIAANLSNDVKLLGFDLHSKNGKINNVYKGTKNYESEDKRAVDPRYWIHQIAKVFECFPSVNFTVYQEEGWEVPEQWKKFNIKIDSINNLV